MSVNNLGTFLNIKDSHLRVVSGNVYAQGINIGGITVDVAHGLQSITNQGNVTTNTLQFDNATTAFTTTANATIGRDLTVTGNATVSSNLTVTGSATVSSNLTVTGNAVVSDDLTVTGNAVVSDDLTVTGNTFYTNPASVLVDSNVVTEYTGPHDRPLRKYPEVALTSAAATASGYNGYKVTFSGQEGVSHFAYEVFDHGKGNLDQNLWYSGSGGFYNTSDGSAITDINDPNVAPQLDTNTDRGDWIGIELPNVIKLKYFDLYQQYNVSTHFPQSGTVYAKKTTSDSWSEIYRYDNVSRGNEPNRGTRFIVNSNVAYKYFTLVGRKRNEGTSGTAGIALSEWELYGHEEGSGSLDTTLKSVYNVPATTGTQLEVYYDAKDLATMPSTVTDLSPNSNDGSPTDVSVSDGAFVFNGTSSLVEKTSLSIPGGDNPLTFSFWLKNDDFDNNQYILRLGDNTTTYQTVALYKNSSNQIIFASFTLDFPIDYTFTSGQWNHISLVYPGGGWKQSNLIAYVDGKPYTFGGNVSSGGLGGTVMSMATSLTLRLGGFASGNTHLDGSIANFRLYSKALNAEQVKELYDYQKDYFLGSKSQVTLYKGHLGVGVTEPSGQLELAGDERIQEYPPRDLGGFETIIEGQGTYKVSSSSDVTDPNVGGNDHPATVFTANDTFFRGVNSAYAYNTSVPALYTGTHFTNGVGGDFVQIELPHKIYLKSINITSRASLPDRAPHTGFIFGSNNGGTTWSQVASWSGLTWTAGESKPIQINSSVLYSTYRLVANKLANTSGGASRFNIDRWQLFGTPGPTTLDKGSLSLTRSLDVPRVSRYDVDTETPRPEKLLVDFDTTVNTSPTDISGKGNHGTFYNGASYSAADKAFNLDGTNDYIRGSCPASLSGNVSYTIALWVKFDTITTNNYDGIVEIGDRATNATSGTFPSIFVYHGANLGFYFSNGGAIVNSGVLPVAGRWYHLVGVYDQGDNKGHFYIDGGTTFIGSGTPANTTNFIGTASVFLGGDSTTDSGQYFDGQISNFKLYDVALEPSEVKKLYNLGRTGRSMIISDTAVGIGKVPEAQLDVRGNISCDGILKPYTCAFSAYVSSGGNSSATGKFPAESVHFNIGNCYNTSTYEFTAPVHGIYHMSFSAFTNTGATSSSRIYALINGSIVEQVGATIEQHGNSLSLTVEMQAGETFALTGGAGVPIYYFGANGHNRFSGHLICAL